MVHLVKGVNAGGGVQAEARLGAVEVVMDGYRRGAVKRAVVYDVADEAGNNLRDCVRDADGKVGRRERGGGDDEPGGLKQVGCWCGPADDGRGARGAVQVGVGVGSGDGSGAGLRVADTQRQVPLTKTLHPHARACSCNEVSESKVKSRA
jgi:hypothetical protein